MNLTLYFDGACEPNPGRGSWGWVLDGLHGVTTTDNGTLAGVSTNNAAECTALGKGLRWLVDQAVAFDPEADTLTIHGDSQLVLKQVTGEWQCKSDALRPLRDRCRELVAELKTLGLVAVTFEWIPREQNERADALSVAAWESAAGRSFPKRRR